MPRNFIVPETREFNIPQQSKYTQVRRQSNQQYPPAILTSFNIVKILTTPNECIHACERFLGERPETVNYESQLHKGMIHGYYFEKAANVKYILQIREKDDEYYLDATREQGCGFLLGRFWTALVDFLAETEVVETEDEDLTDMDFLASLEDDMDMDEDSESELETLDLEYLDLSQSDEALNALIEDIEDPNFKDSSAQTLAHNINKQQNQEVIMQNGQKVFDTVNSSMKSSLQSKHNGPELPFYRAVAILLDCILQQGQIDVSVDQYETMVAATKTWALGSQQMGEINQSEEIATILSKQLSRCVPDYYSPQTQADLLQMRGCRFAGVQRNVNALCVN